MHERTSVAEGEEVLPKGPPDDAADVMGIYENKGTHTQPHTRTHTTDVHNDRDIRERTQANPKKSILHRRTQL